MNRTTQIVFTDLDGTLLNSSKVVSRANIDCLNHLGSKGIIRVISTGRSLFSYNRLLTEPLPVDYLIFSNGAGTLDLTSNTMISSSSFMGQEVSSIVDHLSGHGANFMVHRKVPDNHIFTYFKNGGTIPDFERRIDLYRGYCRPHSKRAGRQLLTSSQIIAIFEPDIELFERVSRGLENFQVTRTTSPLDGESLWMEIYPKHVSKGKGAEWLCSHLSIPRHATMAVGNDYNDISLLDFCRDSFVVENGPEELRRKYRVSPSNDEDGFAASVYRLCS